MANNKQAVIDDFSDDDKVKTKLNLWDYKTDKEIVGVVTNVNEDGLYGLEITLDVGGDEPVVLPSLTQLNTQLKKLKVGDKVKIVSLGKQKSSKTKYSYETFDLFIKSK